jgi:hypothetical protein
MCTAANRFHPIKDMSPSVHERKGLNYMQKNLRKQPFYAKIKVPIVQILYVAYSKLYYALFDLKKVVIFACFNVTIYVELELFNY